VGGRAQQESSKAAAAVKGEALWPVPPSGGGGAATAWARVAGRSAAFLNCAGPLGPPGAAAPGRPRPPYGLPQLNTALYLRGASQHDLPRAVPSQGARSVEYFRVGSPLVGVPGSPPPLLKV
jgi:hypothetical protein